MIYRSAGALSKREQKEKRGCLLYDNVLGVNRARRFQALGMQNHANKIQNPVKYCNNFISRFQISSRFVCKVIFKANFYSNVRNSVLILHIFIGLGSSEALVRNLLI